MIKDRHCPSVYHPAWSATCYCKEQAKRARLLVCWAGWLIVWELIGWLNSWLVSWIIWMVDFTRGWNQWRMLRFLFGARHVVLLVEYLHSTYETLVLSPAPNKTSGDILLLSQHSRGRDSRPRSFRSSSAIQLKTSQGNIRSCLKKRKQKLSPRWCFHLQFGLPVEKLFLPGYPYKCAILSGYCN